MIDQERAVEQQSPAGQLETAQARHRPIAVYRPNDAT